MRDSDKPMSQREAYQRGYAAGYAAAQSGPPREPTQAMLDAGSLVFHREQQKMIPKWEPSIAARFWRAMWDAAPKINGGQGHEAAARCPTEGIAPSEATRLTADASGRMADATQRGQLGADAGSIPAPPTINEGGQDASTRKDEGVSKSPPKRDVPGAFQHPVPPSPDDEYCDHAWKYGARNAGCVIGCGRPRRPKAVRKQEETNTAGADTPVPPSPAAPAPDACNWHQDGEDCDTWQTGCGHYFTINDGTPMDNDFRHCCFCGKPLAQHPHEVDHDDE